MVTINLSLNSRLQDSSRLTLTRNEGRFTQADVDGLRQLLPLQMYHPHIWITPDTGRIMRVTASRSREAAWVKSVVSFVAQRTPGATLSTYEEDVKRILGKDVRRIRPTWS